MSAQQNATAAGAPPEVVRVQGGLLAGVQGKDPSVRVFKGIPYAAAPVGALRWRPPQPPAAWQGVRRADTFGPICPQFLLPKGSFYQLEFYMQDEPQSEDCLYLNVWTAARSAEERRPVMVWFHGGASIEGSGSLPSFHGETLARKGVVLVTINYRLGVLGYFAHPALSAESEHHVSGNYGLLDQIASLRWVRDNIAAFGGDPNNVTIFGQSAGSAGVFAAMVSPLAKGLFQRAIGQSGNPFAFRPAKWLQDAEKAGVAIAQAWGAKTLDELRALPVEILLGASRDAYRNAGWGQNVDGWVLPDAPARLMLAGRGHDVSLLVGATAHEFTPSAAEERITVESFRQQAIQRYGERAEAFLQRYPASSDEEALRAEVASRSESMFAGTRVWAKAHNRRSPGRTYLYYFSRRVPGRNSEFYGAFHSGDLYYVFDTLDSTDRPWQPVDRKLADVMTSYWTNFAATGNPNGGGLPEWPTYQEQDDVVMELGEKVGLTPVPNKARIEFLEGEIARWLERK